MPSALGSEPALQLPAAGYGSKSVGLLVQRHRLEAELRELRQQLVATTALVAEAQDDSNALAARLADADSRLASRARADAAAGRELAGVAVFVRAAGAAEQLVDGEEDAWLPALAAAAAREVAAAHRALAPVAGGGGGGGAAASPTPLLSRVASAAAAELRAVKGELADALEEAGGGGGGGGGGRVVEEEAAMTAAADADADASLASLSGRVLKHVRGAAEAAEERGAEAARLAEELRAARQDLLRADGALREEREAARAAARLRAALAARSDAAEGRAAGAERRLAGYAGRRAEARVVGRYMAAWLRLLREGWEKDGVRGGVEE